MRLAAVLLLSLLLSGLATAGARAELPPPPAVSAVPVPDGQIEDAVGQIDRIATELMAQTGVPGMSVAVVHKGEIVYAKGFGVRDTRTDAPVDAETVFQLASLSKPLGASVVGRVAGNRRLDWDDPVVKHLPGFRLSNRYVSRKVTLADLYSHRSGLPDHAGDLLEDLGYSRSQILRRLRLYPLSPFRDTYAYTNFGLTAAAVAASRAAGTSWAELSRRMIYRPLGMSSTSSRYADFRRAANRADLHVERDGRWLPLFHRDADAQAPAGGASSNAIDMARWMRMILADGESGSRRILPHRQIMKLRTPHITSAPPPTPDSRSGFYALGMGVNADSSARVRLSHSGAFALGAGTNLVMSPSEQLGIIALTNGSPLGVAEATAATFMDLALLGRVERDWYAAYHAALSAVLADRGRLAGRKRPSQPRAARPLSRYVGLYRNRLYGPVRILPRRGRLVLRIGPKPLSFRLRHWSGNTFSYQTVGENAIGIAAVDFRFPGRQGAATVSIENLNEEGLGTFRRSPR